MNNIKYIQPMEIEKKSFEIIDKQLEGKKIPSEYLDIYRRVIHTSADFDYADNLVISDKALSSALNALKNGADIVTDTNMAFAGINKKSLLTLGGKAYCFMSDEDVAHEAAKRKITRAMVCMEKACNLKNNLIIAIGNAPTALIHLDKLIKEGKISPALVIGVPVGFVNVIESKEIIMQGNTPYIVAKGNKGGSNIAASICNALLYMLYRGK